MALIYHSAFAHFVSNFSNLLLIYKKYLCIWTSLAI